MHPRLQVEWGLLLKSVAVKSDLAVVKVYSSEIVYNPGLVMHLLATVSENGSAAYAISTSLSTLAFAVPSSSAKGICERIRRSGEEVEKVTIKDNVSLVCAVGDDLINRTGASAKVFQEAAEAEANIEMISEGASDVASTSWCRARRPTRWSGDCTASS